MSPSGGWWPPHGVSVLFHSSVWSHVCWFFLLHLFITSEDFFLFRTEKPSLLFFSPSHSSFFVCAVNSHVHRAAELSAWQTAEVHIQQRRCTCDGNSSVSASITVSVSVSITLNSIFPVYPSVSCLNVVETSNSCFHLQCCCINKHSANYRMRRCLFTHEPPPAIRRCGAAEATWSVSIWCLSHLCLRSWPKF